MKAKRSTIFYLTEEQLNELEPVQKFLEDHHRENGGKMVICAQIELHDNMYLDQKRGRVWCSVFEGKYAELITSASLVCLEAIELKALEEARQDVRKK